MVTEDIFSLETTNFFKPTVNEVLYYNHLDLLFPNSPDKHDEYLKNLPEDRNWHPYDWGHKSGGIFNDHAQLVVTNSIEKSRVDEIYRMHYDSRQLVYPRSVIESQRNENYNKYLNRWREAGDVWLVKSNVTDDGYAVVVITGIKEVSGTRYINFCLGDTNLDFATDLDIFIQGGTHSNMSYDIVLYEDLEGSLFEDDRRFLHKIGRVHSSILEDISLGKTATFNRGKPFFSESNNRFKHRGIKEFEGSLLSKEVQHWLSTGEIKYNKSELEIEVVKGMKSLEKKHAFLNKRSNKNLDFNDIKQPYIKHLWKLYSTHKDNLIVTSDGELEEEKELVFVNKTDNSEIGLGVNFYNEDN
jgi:hypothetical protein